MPLGCRRESAGPAALRQIGEDGRLGGDVAQEDGWRDAEELRKSGYLLGLQIAMAVQDLGDDRAAQRS